MNANLFAGVNAIVCGVRHAERAAKLTELITSCGGNCVVRKAMASIFAPKAKELDQTITHVISEAVTDASALCKKLNTSSLPPTVKVVNDQWIQDCIERHALQPEEQYLALSSSGAGGGASAAPAGDAPSAAPTDRKRRAPSPDRDGQGEGDGSADGGRAVKRIKQLISPANPGKWEQLSSEDGGAAVQAVYRLAGGPRPAAEMVAFDLDGTLIVTKSGKRFAQSKDDWKFFCPSVPTKLQELAASGKYLAIISNQNGVGKHSTVADITSKIDSILSHIQCPVDVFCAFEKDIYRKPRTGSIELLKRLRVEDPGALRLTYVGDAAGRPPSGTRPKDFAATDLAFALNCGAEFLTPEQLFLNSTSPLHCTKHIDSIGFSWPQFAEAQSARLSEVGAPTASFEAPSVPELIVLVGPPSSGKSTRSRTEFSYAVHVNQDALKTVAKCLAAARTALSSGQSVVVDSTNVDKKTRQQWVQLAQECGVKARCVVCVPPKAACMHLAKFRWLDPNTAPADRREISDVVFHTYFKYYQPPVPEDGFADVLVREFQPIVPQDPESLKLLNSYL